MDTRGKINVIWWNIKVNLQKLVDVCGYELPTSLQNFTQKDLTKVKIFQKVLRGGATFLKHPVFIKYLNMETHSQAFSLSDSPIILVLASQTLWQYSDANLPNGGVDCRCGMKNHDYLRSLCAHNVYVRCTKFTHISQRWLYFSMHYTYRGGAVTTRGHCIEMLTHNKLFDPVTLTFNIWQSKWMGSPVKFSQNILIIVCKIQTEAGEFCCA